jgi:hypothetical protein
MDKNELKAARRAADELWAKHKSYGKITARPVQTSESWAAKWLKRLNIDQYAEYPKKSRSNF